MFATADPKQPFLIVNHVDVFPHDLRILIKLYQPLVGGLGLALYLTLIEDYDAQMILSDSKGIYHLQEQLDCSLQNLFSALHKIEAVGLVQTRVITNEIMGQVLLFQLTRVPSSSEFFATELLASLLKEKVGLTTFQELSHAFAAENKKEKNHVVGMQSAPDVSASFMDVFRLPEEEAISPSADVRTAAKENQVKPVKTASVNKQDDVDWAWLKQQFANYHIKDIEIDQNQDAIRGIMRTYGLSEQEFVDETLPCLHGSYQLDIPLIKKTIAENIHALDQSNELKRQLNTAQPQAVNYNFTAQEQNLLKAAKSMSPSNFLYKLKRKKGGAVAPNENQLLYMIMNRYGLSAEVTNILIYARLRDYPHLSTSFVQTTADDWLQHRITSAEKALNYLKERDAKKLARRKQAQKRYYTAYNSKQKHVEKGTDWSKKKAADNAEVSSTDLKNFFKHLEDENGMK